MLIITLIFTLVGCTASTNEAPVEEQVKTEERTEKETVEKKEEETVVEEQTEEVEQQEPQQDNAEKFNLVAVTVSRVVDGDTIELSDGSKVRLVGVNTPESTNRHEEYGKEASNYTKSKLTGKQVWVQKDVSEADRYNRLLRVVWIDIPTDDMNENEIRTKMFNADLVLNGYAEPSTYPPDVKYSEFFVKFAREARENQTGLWAFGENGTTKGDLDSQGGSTSPSNSGNSSTTPSNENAESFQNCTELRKVYPNGVPSDHPAYQSKMDRDKDNYACER